MEHELFQSKLKASVDEALVSDMIRSSSSGLNSHRAAVMELIIERCIQDRRERMDRKAKDSVRSDRAPQPKGEAPDIPTPQVQSPTSVTALQPPSPSQSKDATIITTSPGTASTNHEPSENSSPFGQSKRRAKRVARREEPSADVKTNPSPPEDFVELACRKCNVKQSRSSLTDDVWCSLCISSIQTWYSMKCTGCGMIRAQNRDACAICHKEFK